ncbi:hypothetical protein DFS33DRAFT_218621 [Desarmillaria ectypa]|nr:hypothetical protein DFS33DRAFT_218621 [Desarmillaria ectypa]
MPRCTRVTLFLAPQLNRQLEALEPLNEPELVNLDGPQGLSPIWYTPPGPPCLHDTDIIPPQLTQTEIRRIRYRVKGKPREEYEMSEEGLSDMLACANINTDSGCELRSPSSDDPSTSTPGLEYPLWNLLNKTIVPVQPSRENSARKLSKSNSRRDVIVPIITILPSISHTEVGGQGFNDRSRVLQDRLYTLLYTRCVFFVN